MRTVYTYKFITSTFSLLHYLLSKSFSEGNEIGPEDAEFSFPEEDWCLCLLGTLFLGISKAKLERWVHLFLFNYIPLCFVEYDPRVTAQ